MHVYGPRLSSSLSSSTSCCWVCIQDGNTATQTRKERRQSETQTDERDGGIRFYPNWMADRLCLLRKGRGFSAEPPVKEVSRLISDSPANPN
eukprot:scaffold1803_cov195-Alexandrium_tamarense.AAC.37